MEKKITISKAQNYLLVLWLATALLLFLVLVIQSLKGTFEITTEDGLVDQSEKVFAWFIPLVFPTISLMLGIVGASAIKNQKTKELEQTVEYVGKSFFQIVMVMCLFYQVLIFAVIFIWPGLKEENPLDVFSKSSYFLSPLQGIVVGLIGVLYTSKKTQ